MKKIAYHPHIFLFFLPTTQHPPWYAKVCYHINHTCPCNLLLPIGHLWWRYASGKQLSVIKVMIFLTVIGCILYCLYDKYTCIFAQKILQHSRLYWWDGSVQIYSNSMQFWRVPTSTNHFCGLLNRKLWDGGLRSYYQYTKLLYILTLPSHQNNLERCKNFWTKIHVVLPYIREHAWTKSK